MTFKYVELQALLTMSLQHGLKKTQKIPMRCIKKKKTNDFATMRYIIKKKTNDVAFIINLSHISELCRSINKLTHTHLFVMTTQR